MEEFEKLIKDATAISMSNGTLDILKKTHPEHQWSGRIEFDFNSKKFSFIGFTDEENAIIKTVRFQ